MIVNKCSENLLTKSKKLYENYRDNCTVVQRMLEKYKKIYPNISDYSIMHFIDIAEFCDLIMDRKKLEGLNEDECYCLLLAALFAHTGFGLNQEIMNRYINRLGIQKQTQSLTFLQIMSKYHVLFSACLIEEYGDIFEFPSEIHKHAIISMLYFIGGNSDDINQLEEVLLSDNQNSVRLKDLAAVLAVGNQLAELKNTNLDLNYEDFDKYNSEEIVGFVERNVVRSIAVKYGKLVIEAGGSDSAYALIERKVNLIINNFEKLLSSLTHGSGDNAGLFGIDSIELKCVLSAENSKKIYLNKEIEESWTEEDIELFNKLSFEERVFYADYLSTEFEITKFLVDFAKTNKAVLAGLEYRVKSPKSLYNKLYQRVEKSFFDSIADVIRYTVILEPKNYVEQIRSVTDALYEKNWKIYSLKNYWVNDSFPYNGVNAKFKNSRNYRIEIQFHTQESFDVKMSEEDHKLYEQRRVLESGCDEYNRILQLQLKLYSDMEYPENIEEKLSAKINLQAVDALSLAEKAGTIEAVNVVLIGLLAKSMDVDKNVWIDVIKETVPEKFLDVNIKAFELGYEL